VLLLMTSSFILTVSGGRDSSRHEDDDESPIKMTLRRRDGTTQHAFLPGTTLDITWMVTGTIPQIAEPGQTVLFQQTWGVDPASVDSASGAVMSAGFWNGGQVGNVVAGKGANCTVDHMQTLICFLGPIERGHWGPNVSWEVFVPKDYAIQAYLPVFLGGRSGFDEGPESFARLQVVQ